MSTGPRRGGGGRRRRLVLWVAISVTAASLASCRRDSTTTSQPVESPASARFNGTWVREGAELGLWAIDEARLQAMFRGHHEYVSDAGPMVNVGEADGFAVVDGDTATFRPTGGEADCIITMRADTGRLDVREQGACGFGLNVTAEGTYHRTSTDRPAFVSPAQASPAPRAIR